MDAIAIHGLNTGNIAMCMVTKIFLMLVFVSIDVVVSVAAKQKARVINRSGSFCKNNLKQKNANKTLTFTCYDI